MNIYFEKWHGTGNDFVMIQNWEKQLVLSPQTIQFLCDRHFGIGADAVILVEPSTRAGVKMNYFNADGTPSETCGNGLRCTGAFVKEHGYIERSKQELSVENPNGSVATLSILSEAPWEVRVNMGTPAVFGKPDFPDNFLGKELDIEGEKIPAWCVSMGNPHTGLFVESVDAFPVATMGPKIENHSLFPNRTNVEFIEVLSPTEARVRIWERGVGETLSCGSGSAATAVMGTLSGKFAKNAPLRLHIRGGTLEILWDQEKNVVFKTGKAQKVFAGEISLK